MPNNMELYTTLAAWTAAQFTSRYQSWTAFHTTAARADNSDSGVSSQRVTKNKKEKKQPLGCF